MAQMHLSRTVSAVLTTVTLITTEHFCNASVAAESFGTRTRTKIPRRLHSITTDHRGYRHAADNHHHRHDPATPVDRRAAAPFNGVCCITSSNLYRKSGLVDWTPVNKAIIEGKNSRDSTATWDSQQTLRMASYWLIKSLIKVTAAARPHTSLSMQTRRRLSADDAAELKQRQATRLLSRNAIGQKARRRPPLVTDDLAGQDNELDKETTDNSSQPGGWSGDPEMSAIPLVNTVKVKHFGQKYFVGKRHHSHSDGLVSAFSLA